MVNITLSRAAFENVVRHLVEIEESKQALLDRFFFEPSKERTELEAFIGDYITKVDQLVKKAKVIDNGDNCLPFVTIGAEIEVLDLENRETFKFKLVNPQNNGVQGGDVSFISPVGRSLSLKKVGDEVTVSAPGGLFRYEIKSIILNNAVG